MTDIREGDLSGIQILERDIRRLHHVLKHVSLLVHLTRVISIEGKGLAGEIHLLKLALFLPGAVLHRQVHVGAVAAAGIGEHAAGGIPKGGALFLCLLQSVLAYEVLLEGLIRLSRHLHSLINQSHLVDE